MVAWRTPKLATFSFPVALSGTCRLAEPICWMRVPALPILWCPMFNFLLFLHREAAKWKRR